MEAANKPGKLAGFKVGKRRRGEKSGRGRTALQNEVTPPVTRRMVKCGNSAVRVEDSDESHLLSFASPSISHDLFDRLFFSLFSFAALEYLIDHHRRRDRIIVGHFPTRTRVRWREQEGEGNLCRRAALHPPVVLFPSLPFRQRSFID